MKKIKALMFAFVLAGMTVVSCSSDDSSGPVPTIEGKWNQVKTVTKIKNGPSNDVKYNGNENGCDKDYLEFATSSVFNDVVFNKNGGGECLESKTPGTWTKNDKVLVIQNAGLLSGTYEIIKLKNNVLQVANTIQTAGNTVTTTIYLTKAK